jgi:uncharacterized phage protein (TIGR01671 family)
MREIKFRAWNKWADRNEMAYFNLDTCMLDTLAYNAPIMQYTGLKDKNGKEIYEGDVVNRSFPGGVEFKGTVKFYECAFWIDNGKQSVGLFSEIDEITILGNIYENPELLEGANYD